MTKMKDEDWWDGWGKYEWKERRHAPFRGEEEVSRHTGLEAAKQQDAQPGSITEAPCIRSTSCHA